MKLPLIGWNVLATVHRSPPTWIAAALLLALAFLHSEKSDPHNTDCGRCHLGDPASAGSLFQRDIDRLCKECHDRAENVSHPVGMTPSMRVPEDLHLDWQGRLTCASCHDIHQQQAYPYKLRRPQAGRPFCEACHRSIGDTRAPLTHSMITDSAHGKPRFRETGSRSLPIDQESMECLGCHDGSIAGLAESTIRGEGVWEHGENIGLTHPIGVDYVLASATDHSLAPVGSLNPAVRLYSGKVGCGSCHSAYSKLPKLLVLDNRGSNLCLQCHRV